MLCAFTVDKLLIVQFHSKCTWSKNGLQWPDTQGSAIHARTDKRTTGRVVQWSYF